MDLIDALSCNRRVFVMENDGFWRTVWRPRSMNNDKRTGSGSKWFLFFESLWGLMNSRISTEYVSIESGRDHELLIVIFQKFYKFPYSFLHYLDAIMDEMRKGGRPSCPIFLPMWTSRKPCLKSKSILRSTWAIDFSISIIISQRFLLFFTN